MEIAYALTQIMNAKRSGKEECKLEASNLLIEILEIMKKQDYADYKVDKENNQITVKIRRLNECKAIKPRFNVRLGMFERYIRRYLPARDIGVLIISTSKGLMIHQEALEKGVGGSLVAYCF